MSKPFLPSDDRQTATVCYSTPWVELVAIPPRLGNGSPHYALVSKDYVSVLAIDNQDNILLVRQYRPAIGCESLELPAGHVEDGQTPEQAAAQELLEETGFAASSLELLGVMHPDSGRLTNKHWCFFATGLKQVEEKRAEDEVAELSLTPLSQLPSLMKQGVFNHAQHLATLALAMAQGKLSFPTLDIAKSDQSIAFPTPTRSGEQQDVASTDVADVASQVCVVGGAGHVGLPLALVMAEAGMQVLIYDQNKASLAKIADGEMPFTEADAQPLLRKVLSSGRIKLSSHLPDLAHMPNIIVTIGTPVDEFLNPGLSLIRKWINDLMPFLSDEQLIMLRSTLYPGTTNWLNAQVRQAGKKTQIAFCPERIVQGQAIRELPILPQIVSGTTPEAEDAAASFWSKISPNIVRMKPLEAEFAKLICNAYRYIQFAVSNQLFMITTEAGVDYGRVMRGLKENYPRMRDFPSAGFAAGPCLLKDTMQLAAYAQNRFTLGHNAMQVNEGLALWLVNELSRSYDLSSMTIGLLGMAFKAEVDDVRASLSYKLKKALTLRCRNVLTADPHVTSDPELIPAQALVDQSDLLILGAPHAAFRQLDRKGKPFIDIWGAIESKSGLLSELP